MPDNCMNKYSRNRDLSSLSSGRGPEQMENALNHLNQAIALARPGKEEFKRYNLREKGYNKSVDRLKSESSGSKFNASELAPEPDSKLPAVLGLAGLIAGGALPADSLKERFSQGLAAGAVTGSAGLGYNAYKSRERKNMLNTLKLLKDYGVLKPDTLKKAYPVLRDFE